MGTMGIIFLFSKFPFINTSDFYEFTKKKRRREEGKKGRRKGGKGGKRKGGRGGREGEGKRRKESTLVLLLGKTKPNKTSKPERDFLNNQVSGMQIINAQVLYMHTLGKNIA